jgi:hypothetical protein
MSERRDQFSLSSLQNGTNTPGLDFGVSMCRRKGADTLCCQLKIRSRRLVIKVTKQQSFSSASCEGSGCVTVDKVIAASRACETRHDLRTTYPESPSQHSDSENNGGVNTHPHSLYVPTAPAEMFSPPGDTRQLLQSNDNASDHRSDNDSELKEYSTTTTTSCTHSLAQVTSFRSSLLAMEMVARLRRQGDLLQVAGCSFGLDNLSLIRHNFERSRHDRECELVTICQKQLS